MFIKANKRLLRINLSSKKSFKSRLTTEKIKKLIRRLNQIILSIEFPSKVLKKIVCTKIWIVELNQILGKASKI
jgi:hypothetical protein